jgi:hypothetical protein
VKIFWIYRPPNSTRQGKMEGWKGGREGGREEKVKL